MASLRNILRNQPAAETRAEIESDIKAARGAQQTAAAHGQHQAAETMRQAADGFLDELNQLNNGTWQR